MTLVHSKSIDTGEPDILKHAFFRFYGKLNDFLPSHISRPLRYPFRDHPTVKHAVESIGPPHPEIGMLLLHGHQVGFGHVLGDGDEIDVFPVTGNWLFRDSTLRRRYLGRPGFVLDVHLGTLARRLRLLGFDTLYSNRYEDSEIALLASKRERIVLTRDVGMLMWCDIMYGYWVRSQQPHKQTAEVVRHFGLEGLIRPFHRCTMCNGPIVPVKREALRERVKPEILTQYHEFFQCGSCGRVYWKGSHFRHMAEMIDDLMGGEAATPVEDSGH
jgi:uncharacterized protein with PIN domain